MVTLESIHKNIGTANNEVKPRGLPPVHLWNPPYCGDIDMRIASDGRWFYNGTPINRPAMVQLFSTILRRDPERYVLVTPVEMVGITVEDAPFLAVEMAVEEGSDGRNLRFRSNVDDWVTASHSCPMRFEQEEASGFKPYVLIRNNLWARLSRPVTHELVALATTRMVGGVDMLGIASANAFFPISPAADIEGWA